MGEGHRASARQPDLGPRHGVVILIMHGVVAASAPHYGPVRSVRNARVASGLQSTPYWLASYVLPGTPDTQGV